MIRLLLTPTAVHAAPGVATSVTIEATNDGATAWTGSLRLVGVDASWVDGMPDSLAVEAGTSVEVPLTITLPTGFPAGAQLIGVEATTSAGDPRPALASLQLVVSSLDGISLGLGPASVRGGWRGRFRLNLLNRGNQTITLRFSGRGGIAPAKGSKDDLSFRFKPEEITLRPGERARTRAWVSGRRPALGAPKTRPMTIVAQSTSAPLQAAGRFTQRPLLSKATLRVVGLVLMLGMWAGSLVTAVNFSQKQRTETAADASAETSPAEGDGAEGDGDGEDGGAEGEEGEGSETPPTGATIAGQITGLADRSGVRVDIRPVSLAQELSTEIELVSADDDGKKRKRFGLSIGHEPIGAVAPTASTSTDDEGFWAFGGLTSPANYELTFSKAGFGTRTYIVTVDEEHGSVALEVAMEAGDGTLSGTVRGPDGPLGGATVTVTDGAVTYTTTTPTSGDGVGTWSVSGLGTPASYLVTAERRGFGTETVSVALGGTESRDGVDLALVPGVGSINGTISGAGEGLGGVLVTAASEELERSVTTLTDSPVGSYAIPQLPIPGTYTLTVTADGWISQTQRIELTGNESDVDFSLSTTTASISGTVTDDDGPLAAVGVTVSLDDEPLVKTLSAETPRGTYEVSGLQPGTYVVSFERFGYTPKSAIVEIAAGDRATADAELVAEPAAAAQGAAIVRGIVRSGSDGEPISGVDIELADESTETDSEGSFVLEGLAAGTFEIMLTHASHQTTTRVVRLGVEDDMTLDITMPVLGGMQGQITDLTAEPLEGVTVSIEADPDSETDDVDITPVTTDEEGEYSILESLPTGAYVATFELAGFDTRTRDFEATAGSVTTVDMTLLELAGIDGTVSEPATGVSGGFEPLDDVTITLTLVDGATETVVEEREIDGEFSFDGLFPGDYVLTATKDGYGTVEKEIDDLELREVADGSMVLDPGSQTIGGDIYWIDSVGDRIPVDGAVVTTNAIVGFRTLTVFPFIQPSFQALTDTTGADGVWSVFGPTAGSTSSYTVTATGFTTRTLTIDSPVVDDEGDIELQPIPRDLAGSVTLLPVVAGGLTDVTVTAALSSPTISSGLPGNKTLTVRNNGTSGTFEFDDLDPATYTVTLTAPGYTSATATVTVAPGDPNVDVSAGTTSLQKVATAAVTVTSSAGGAVSGATVTRTPGAVSTTTNGSGLASFSALSAGTAYTFTVSQAGYETTSVTRTPGAGEDMVIDVTLNRYSRVQVDVDSELDGIDTALAGATVTATLLDDGDPTATVYTLTATVTTGLYEYRVSGNPDGLAPGSYRFAATRTAHSPASADVTLTAGTDRTGLDAVALDLLAYPVLTVAVDQRSGGVTTDYDDATVTAYLLEGGTGTDREGTTVSLTHGGGDPAGQYASAGAVAPGYYEIEATAAAHTSDLITVQAVAGTSADDGVLEVAEHSAATITVQRVADAGAAAAYTGATVTAYKLTAGVGTARTATTVTLTHAGGGSYTTSSRLTPGSYEIEATATAHALDFAALTAVAGDDYTSADLADPDAGGSRDASIVVLAYPTLSLTLNSSAGGVVTDATVRAYRLTGGTGSARVGGQTPVDLVDSEDDGTYVTAAAVTPASYEIDVSKTSFASATITGITATAGGANYAATTTLQRHSSLTVTVDELAGGVQAPYTGATVTVHLLDDDIGSDREGTTISLSHAGGGSYTTATLFAPGSYEIEATATDHVTDVVAVTAVAGADLTNTDFADPDGAGAGDDDLVLAKYSSVTVTVQRIADAGAATAYTGATVTAHKLVGAVGTARSATTVSLGHDGGGSYSTSSLLTPGSYEIEATASTHDLDFAAITVAAGSDYANTDLVDPDGPGTRDGSIVVLAWPSLQVTVQSSATGNPAVADASVTAFRLTLGVRDAGTALVEGVDGVYTSAAGLNPGDYEIDVVEPGYESETLTGIATTAGGADYADTVTLQRYSALVVTVDELASGATAPYDDATVTAHLLDGVVGSAREGTTITLTRDGGDPAGEYTASTYLAPGSYEIEATAGDHVTDLVAVTAVAGADLDDGDLVDPDGAGSYDNDLVLAKHSSLRVSVEQLASGASTAFNDATVEAHLLVGAVGTAREGTTVALAHGGGDPDGVYIASSLLPPGAYEIEAGGDDHESDVVAVTAVAGADLTDTDVVDPDGAGDYDGTLVVAKHSNVTVTVQRIANAGAAAAYTGATVTAHRLTGAVGTARAGTTVALAHDGGGSYTTSSLLTPGVYEIEATSTAHDLDFAAVTVVAGDDYANADLTDPDGGGARDGAIVVLAWPTLQLTVSSSATGNPAVSGATVTAYRLTLGVRDAGTALVEGAAGVYTSTAGLNPGDYEIDVSKSGFDSDTVDGISTTAGGANVDDAVTLQRHSSVVVTVKSNNGDGTPDNLSGATVSIAPSGGGASTSFTDNGDGTYTGPTLSPGDYVVSVTASGHNSGAANVTATAGNDLTPTVTLLKHPTVSVTVRSEIYDDDGDDVEEPTDKFYSALTTATVTAARAGGGSVTFSHQGAGVYTATIATDGVYTLSVSATGHVSDTDDTVDIGPGDSDAAVAIDLRAQTGTISGTVRKINGSGLNNVTITAVSANGDVATAGPTTGNGQFTLTGLAAVTWDVTYSRDTYSPLTQSITVLKNSTVTTTATMVEVGGTIQGSVYQKASNEVAVGAGNPSSDLNGATVKLYSNAGVLLRTTTLGSTSNDYTFTNLSPATYDITVEKSGYQEGGTYAVNDIAVGAAEIVTAADATLYQSTGTVTATAVSAASGNPAITTQDVKFTLANTNLLSAARVSGFTNASGTVTFTSVPPGSGYTITVSTLPATLVEVTGGGEAVTVTSGNTTSHTEELIPIGSVSGTVSADDSGDITAESTLAGATVRLRDADDPTFQPADKTTEGDGDYEAFTSVPDYCDCTLTFSKSGYETVTTTGVTVTRGATADVDATLRKLAALTVTVVNDAGDPVEGASVAVDGATDDSDTTDVNGQATFTDLEPGAYDITVTDADHFDGSDTITLAYKDVESVTVAVNAEIDLVFTVTESVAADALPGVEITITLDDSSTLSATSDVNGEATFADLEAGQTIDWVASDDGGANVYDDETGTEPIGSVEDNSVNVSMTLTV